MGMIKEFREFAMRGSVIDLAVGVIIGAAFGKIVTSMVEDVIMPPIGLALGKVDFANLYIPLSDKVTKGIALVEAKKQGPVIAYGQFINVTINFVIVAFCIFLVIKAINTAKARFEREKAAAAAAPAVPPADVALLTEIRDLLKAK